MRRGNVLVQGKWSMEIHEQRCPQCEGTAVRNLLVLEPGQSQMVYVTCVACDRLVARYVLSSSYDEGQGLESWLRSAGGSARESGRDFLRDFERVKNEVAEGYALARQRLREDG